MKKLIKLKRPVAMLLALVMLFSLLPVHAHAAESGRESDTIFFATDRHQESSKLNSLLKALAYAPGLVVLGGDHVNNTNSGSLASITSEIQAVYPGVQTFYTYAAHDPNVSEDSSNPYAYARTGEYYEGEDYYVYGVDQNDMQSASSAATASANFKSWADTIDSSKVIFVMCHMPIHSRRGDNAGGATWMNALNEVGQSHDIVFLWGHNHTGESSADTSVYFVSVGGSLTPQGGSTGTINFTYMNAGYIKNGYASMVVVNDDVVNVTRYSTSGSATASYTIERRFSHTHTWEVTENVAATCTEDGSATYTCACGDTYTEVIAALGHSYEAVVTESTCTEKGYTTYTCACGDSYVADEVAAPGHVYETVTVTATCTEDGSVTYTCACGDTYTETVAALGHAYEAVVTAPTCESEGYTTYTCACGDSYVAEEVAALGHDYESVTVAPTCTENGYTGNTCVNCGDTTVTEETAALGHSYESVVTAPTCEAEGCTTHTCTVCGETYVDAVVDALGHTYETVTVKLTCTEDGYNKHTCTTCGYSYVSDYVEAPGHNFIVTEENGYNVYTCDACGDSYSDEVVVTYNRVNVISNGNTYVITVYSGGKYYALSHNGTALSIVEVQRESSWISSEVTEDLLWDYSGNKLSYEYNGSTYYLYAIGNNRTLSVSTTRSSTVSYSGSRLKVGSYYLRYINGKIITHRAAGTTYMFVEG